MKSLLIATLTLSLISSLAMAQGTSKAKKAAPPTYNYDPDSYISDLAPTYMVNGFNMGFEYMTTNSSEMDSKSKVTGTVEKGIKGDASNIAKQMGLKGGYKVIPRGGFGYDVNLSLLKSEGRNDNTADTTNILPSANIILAAPQYVYGALGVNTNLVLGDTDAKYSARLGYQVGAGAVIGKNFNVEVFYNWINTGVEEQYALMEIRTATTNARLIYIF